jgi:hypothetical protein
MKASVPEFEAMPKRQFDTLYREGETVPRVMAIAVHPFVTGQPHRIVALDAALEYICSHDGVWRATRWKSYSTTCRGRRDPHLSGKPTRAVLDMPIRSGRGNFGRTAMRSHRPPRAANSRRSREGHGHSAPE